MAWEKLGTASVSGAVANTSWKLLARGTGSGTTADTGTFTAKDNLMILGHSPNGTQLVTYNSDTGSNYANRRSEEGGTDSTQTSQSNINFTRNAGEDVFFVGDLVNAAAQEKLGVYHQVSLNSAGAGNVPKRQEWAHKWANTSDQITRVTMTSDSGSYSSDDEILVLGYDNDEADSGTNFWQELASVTRTDSGSTLESGNFATKKYLMVEACTIPANNGFKGRLEFGHSNGTMDTGNNYTDRYEQDGGADSTNASSPYIYAYTNHDDHIQHLRMFIVNKSAQEKLVLWWASSGGSTAGAGNAPQRRNGVAKWVNTSYQMTNIRLNNQIAGGDAASGSFIKVYGAD